MTPLQYYLNPNHMTSNPDDYMAVSKNPGSYQLEDIFDHMTREGSTVTKAEALAGFEEVIRGIVSLLQEGNSVITPLVNISPSISGVFEGEDDRFDPDRHQININVSAGKRLKEMARDIPTEKVAATDRRPKLVHYHDNSTESEDSAITPNGGARITGTLLKFDEDDETQGIFFINTDDNSETRVDGKLLKNKPGELIFLNPDLANGTYRLEVRSLLENTSEVRTGTLTEDLTVSGSG